MGTANRWCVDEADLANLDLAGAVRLVQRCFTEAHKETFAEAHRKTGAVDDEAHVKATIEGAVRNAFREVGGDYDTPTFESLQQAVGVLARKAGAWGTPDEVIEHHKGEIGRIFAALQS